MIGWPRWRWKKIQTAKIDFKLLTMHSLNFGYSKKGDKDRRYGHIETK